MYDIGGGVRRRVRAERETESYGTLSHLCPSHAPRVGELDAGDEVARARAGRGPQPERAVDVHPRAVLVGDPRAAPRSSHAPVFTLPACRHTIVGPRGRRAGEHVRSSATSIAPLVVGRDRLDDGGAEPEQAQRAVDGRVPLGTRDDPHPGRADAARRVRRPNRPRPARDDGPRRARPCWPPGRRSRSRPSAWPDAEQLLQPAARDLLGDWPRPVRQRR